MSAKILILTVSLTKLASSRPRMLGLAVRFLQLCGYRFATVSEALAAPAGKLACLTIEGQPRSIRERLQPYLTRQAIPATVFAPVADVDAEEGWAGLRALATHGWEIGCAGLGTVPLTEQTYGEQHAAVVEARRVMAERLGVAPRVFAYPFGAYDATTVRCVKDAGFEAAVTLRPGVNGGTTAGAYHLRRVGLATTPIRDMTTLVRHALTTAPESDDPIGRVRRAY